MAEENEDHQSELAKPRGEWDLRRGEAQRVADAIAASGHSPTLLATLANAENKISGLDMQIEA